MTERKEAVRAWHPGWLPAQSKYRNLETGLVKWFAYPPKRGKWERVFSNRSFRPLGGKQEADGE